MINYFLLILTLVTLWSCGGGGESNSTPPITEPIVVNPPRDVRITISDKFLVNEKSTLKIDLSLSGPLLASDKVLLTANSQLVVAQINSDRNIITIDVLDVNQDTDAKIKMTIEGPSNTPSKEITVSITNTSANAIIQKMNDIIEKTSREYEYSEELHVGSMLSLIATNNRTSDINQNETLSSFIRGLTNIQNKINDNIKLYRNTINKYQEKSIDETMLDLIYKNNSLSKTNYNAEKLSALNDFLTNIALPIEFPENTDSLKSNFFGNAKIGDEIGGQFYFNKKYYYLNSILDKTCIGN